MGEADAKGAFPEPERPNKELSLKWQPQDAARNGSCFAAVFFCPFSVGADAHIGPVCDRGTRADVGIRPYGEWRNML
jgi:hypothetical protein